MEWTAENAALGAFVLWCLAGGLLALGRHTTFPLLPGVEPTVVAGAGVLTLVGWIRSATTARR